MPAAEAERAGTLLPASETIPGLGPQPSLSDADTETPAERKEKDDDEASRVFAKLKELTRPAEQGD